MDSITITVKVIDALICQKYIVTKNYLQELVESSENRKKIPEPKKYFLKIF